MRIRGNILLFHDWFHTVCTGSQRAQINFLFSNSTYHTNYSYWMCIVQHNFCSVMCYTVLIWILILLTLGNNIDRLLFNWPKPVHYIPTDKINASICIRIRRILKVKISIRLMTNFVTSLVVSNKKTDIWWTYTVGHEESDGDRLLPGALN